MKNKPSKVANPLTRKHMPEDFEISLDAYINRDSKGQGYREGEPRIPTDLGLPQSMQGFENTYRNIIDYIVRITFRIWEDRDVGYIAKTYAQDSMVYDDYGLQRGSEKIIFDTHHTTGAFSNIRLIADDVIWAGNDEIGYHTSHRTLIRGTNDGDSKYGPATGRDVDVLVIANCVALGNEIFLEHVLYNNSCLVTQLGHNLEEVAARMVQQGSLGWPRSPDIWQDLRSAAAPPVPLSLAEPVTGFDVDAFARSNWHLLWNEHDFSALERNYIKDFSFSGTTDRVFKGADSYAAMVSEIRQCFPDLQVQIDEVYWMGNENDGYLSSERWSGTATHSGEGKYGAPTGAEIQIWGISQHRIVSGLIEHEWMLFNELELMMQLAAARS
ncbi:MAG: ester cyclase [Halioglobus sp.]